MSDEPAVEATSLRQRVALTLFKVGLVAFLASGAAFVVLQAVALVAGNASMALEPAPGLGTFMTGSAAVTGLIGFVMSYMFSYEGGGED